MFSGDDPCNYPGMSKTFRGVPSVACMQRGKSELANTVDQLDHNSHHHMYYQKRSWLIAQLAVQARVIALALSWHLS